jgi:membrane fusion protein (multidrug efflux system)
VVDGQSGTVRVVVDLPPDSGLRPGMFADVKLVLDAHADVVVVPKKALVYEDETPHVFIVQDGKAVRTPVRLGYQDAGRAEVVEGLDAGDMVVLVGQSTLKDGSPVQPETEDGRPVEGAAPPEVTAAAGAESGGPPPRGAAASAGS